MARVNKFVKDNNCHSRGIKIHVVFSYHSLYEVSFPNGQTEELTANVFSDNMLFQVYSEVHPYQVLKEISDHSE